MLDTKNIASALATRYKTRNPFELADDLGYIVLRCNLAGVRGFYQRYHRNHLIYIDESLSEPEQKFVCAHEIGHAALHVDHNRIFMDSRTLMVTSRFENEANRFAVDLLYDDSDLRPYWEYSSETVARCLGVSQQLAEYRMSTVEPMLW